MPELSSTEISELICTRMSHDIIGNIGAVSNAVELLEEGDMDFLDDIKSILKNSSSVLTSRLKFFRMVFGSANANLDKLDMVKNITQDYLLTLGNKNYPIELSIQLQHSELSKIAMLSVMIIADTLIRGGKIEVVENNQQLQIYSAATSRSNEKISEIKKIVDGCFDDISAQYAPLFYLQELLKERNLRLGVSNLDNFGLIIA